MTRYAVVGASSGTGLQLVERLAQRGSTVRAISRNPLPSRGLVEPYKADITDFPSIKQALHGDFDAVFFTADIHGRKLQKDVVRAVMYDGFINTLRAAHAGGSKRIVLLSVIGPERPSWVWWILNSMKPGMRDNVRDREEVLKASPMPYVICRAARLTDKPGGGEVAVRSAARRLDMMSSISRHDLSLVLAKAADCAPAGTTWDVLSGSRTSNPTWTQP